MLPKLAEVVAFRAMTAADVPFVMDTWSKCWRVSPWAGTIPNNRIHEIVRETVAGLLSRGARVEIACAKSDPDKILGYTCHEHLPESTVIHWTYVKDPYRQMGLATELIERNAPQGTPRYYTHRTRDAAYFRGWRHAPEIARRK
jgi:hypothetical protein